VGCADEKEETMIVIHSALLIAALICFLLAAGNVASPRWNLIAAGLALWVASLILTMIRV
jgi:hypothetical protein